jgi:hypothetical protein
VIKVLFHFPQPYPDELFYSILARYSKRTPEINDINVIQALFDKKMSNLGKSIPYGISSILEQLKVFEFPSENEIIKNHTLYYFYVNFNSPFSKKEKYEELLHGSKQGDRKVQNGITLNYSPNNFQFCPACMDEDIEKYGETYWRASFQLPTVLICQKHKTLLDESIVSIYTNGLIPATRDNCKSESNLNNRINQKARMYLLLFAKESDKLAKEELNFYFEAAALILVHLNEKGLLDRYGTVKKEDLLHRLIKFYGLKFFEIIDLNPIKFVDRCEETDFELNTLNYIEKLVLIIYLAGNIENFISTVPINEPVYEFIQNPRCKNKRCKRPVRLGFYSRFEDNMRRKITTISYNCTCGIIFGCILGDKDVFELSEHCFYASYNPDEFSKKIREEIYVNNLSIPEVAKVFNLHILEVEILLHKSSNEVADDILIQNYREKWSKYIRAKPKKHYLQIKYEKLEIYTWLYRNDISWLLESIEESYKNEINQDFLSKRDFFIKEYLRSTLHQQILYQYKGRHITKWLRHPFISEYYLSKELEFLPCSSKYVEKIGLIYDKHRYKRFEEPITLEYNLLLKFSN